MMLHGKISDWAKEFNAAITICDTKGIIVYMNDLSKAQFAKYGGEKLIGTNLLDCHPEPSKSKLSEMLNNPTENMYTTEKEGRKKIILQSPWMKEEVFSGIVELSFYLDDHMSHFVRD